MVYLKFDVICLGACESSCRPWPVSIYLLQTSELRHILGIDLKHYVKVYSGNAEVVELGRHTILRGWRAKARAGSSPAFGTTVFQLKPDIVLGFFIFVLYWLCRLHFFFTGSVQFSYTGFETHYPRIGLSGAYTGIRGLHDSTDETIELEC